MAVSHVERVGGGYSYGLDLATGSPRRPKPVAPKGAVSAVVKEFDATGVRAIEVLQGGATVWTAEDDGSIKLRNGFTGEVAHTIPPKGAGLVERLYAAQNLMWVGLNDGGVRVYDHLVVENEWPSDSEPEKPHTGPVKFFQPLYDDSMLSGSTDGLIIKWAGTGDLPEGQDNDGQEVVAPYTHVCKVSPSASLTALEASSTFVFAGDLQGFIYVLDASDLSVIRQFEAHPSATVTCLKYQDGILFSGGSDGCLNAWSMVTQGDPDRTPVGDESWHSCAIRKLVGDSRAHQMWSIDESGRIMKWESTAPFGPRNSTPEGAEEAQPLECGPFHDLTTFASWDAVRVWSTGSNGANFSWFAQWSRAEEQMNFAIDSMNIMIKTDQTRLTTWQQHIDRISDIDRRRKANLAHALAANTDKGTRYIYYRKWLTWLRRMQEIHRRQTVVGCIERTTSSSLRRVYYGKLFRYLRLAKQARQKTAMLDNLLCTTERGLRRTYWKKVAAYRARKKREQHRQDLAQLLIGQHDKTLRQVYWRELVRHTDKKKLGKKRALLAAALLRSADTAVTRTYFFKLLKFRQEAKRRTVRKQVADMMLSANRRVTQRIYFLKLVKWGQSQRQVEQSEKISRILQLHSERNLLAAYQQKCDDWLTQSELEKKRALLEQRKAREQELIEEQKKEEARMQRVRELEKLREKRNELKEKRDQLKQDVARSKEELEDLKERVANRASREEEKKETREKLKDCMAKLKEVALNFDSDHQLIITTTDKCKSVAVHKMFLQAHMEVKRVVLQVVKKPDLEEGAEWPLDGKYKKIEKFQYNTIWKAIKTLVITFDIMTLVDLDNLDTDDEIVVNAENLMRLYLNAARSKARQPIQEYGSKKRDSKASQSKEEIVAAALGAEE